MRPRYKILLFTLSLYIVGSTVFNGTQTSSQEYDAGVTNSQNRFIIASYHPGSADITEPDTIKAIADILSRFEIVALQCIRDENADAVLYELVGEMNRYGHQYGYLLGPIVEDTPTRYAFVYRTDIIYPVQWYTYDDAKEHDFLWEPFVARFKMDDDMFDVTIVNYYTEPASRPREIDFLPLVINDAKKRFPDETDVIVLCSAKPAYYSLSFSDPFKSLEQEDYFLLLDAETTHFNGTDNPVVPQIIIAASSEKMYWEDAGLVAIDAESSTGQDTGAVLSTNQAGFSSVIIVNDEPEDTEDKKEGSSSKAFCFFGTTSG
ncbi:MAG: hypothetical protein WBR24_16635 [Desulfobacterales bacterium]|jgi:hypothetical protein